ncbi:hypothetical protein CLAFUW4_01030 [Fulvia fulva]|uniref:Gag1-like clamp domain-containing protein n=1 Tax=Passalora fulva TaxID=5499 RepID=A0A9Q8L8I4_PASFU|nr:uncharacterized protein CLAFUR5_01035 [Fulvia fulva]KAK4634176.1 hypothetical protein CLAFUR4_01031 [Fulvia fulva]KAK4636971.1 hypothetical protein CLAFUR0_01032 [Fulvia fulva]UJO12769.1 hypothetical protein CLAFUR5_01035 [Fulvia fulva]WPV09548.1 hypothetical protein CLAFUW4_01030 [Fulvia fulva]WPV23371.1 hypothetical protein CLAFUW7_01035 [Fulvia fulva]
MTLHLSLPGSHHHNKQTEQQQEVREARRQLKERIRNDWQYPPLPEWRSSGRHAQAQVEDAEARIAGFRFHTPNKPDRLSDGTGEALGLDFDPLDWREREYSSNDDSDVENQHSPAMMNSKSSSKGSVSKFDSPDSVGAQLSNRHMAKKRKRWQALEEEMSWNYGLSHWMRRRDAWCCARTATDVSILENSQHGDQSGSASGSVSSSPRTSTSSMPAEEHSTPGSTPSISPDIGAGRTMVAPTTVSPVEVLVPIAPPLLPDHPVRRKITPNMFPEIYTKVILQSRTPSVPINLQTLVTALVQGWKDDGEWPPKSGPLEKSIGRKKGSHTGGIKEGVKRVLRITSVGESGKS